jgi:hypothetical protein
MSTSPFSELIKQAAEAKFVVVPAETYAVICKDASSTTSSTGKPMLKLNVRIVLGPHKGAGTITQQTLSAENPAAVQIFLKFLAAFGLDEDFLQSLPPAADGGPNFVAVASALKGRVAMAKFDVHEWAGEDRNGVERFTKPKPEEEAAIRQVLESEGTAAGAFGAPSAGPADPFAASAEAAPAAGAEGTSPEVAGF